MSPLPASSARYTPMPVFALSEAKLPSSHLALHVLALTVMIGIALPIACLTVMIGIALPIAWRRQLRRKSQN
jgi:hypothetical protein